MTTTQILIALMKLFATMLPGWCLGRLGVLKESHSKLLSTIVLNISWPCLIVMSLQRECTPELVGNMGFMAILLTVAAVVSVVLGIACKAVIKEGWQVASVVIFMLMFGNTGLLGIAVNNVLYGSMGVFYGALVDAIQDIFLFTFGVILIQKSAGGGKGLDLRGLLTPGFASVVMGLGLFFAGVALPDVVATPLEWIGSTMSPLGMTIVGFQLSQLTFRELISDRRIYVISFFRLVAMPLVMLAILLVVFPEMSVMCKVLTLQLGTPVAACTIIYCQQYDGDVAFATKAVMLSTVLSTVSLSVMAILIEMI